MAGNWIGVLSGPDSAQVSGWSPEFRDSIWLILSPSATHITGGLIDFHMAQATDTTPSVAPAGTCPYVRYPSALSALSDANVTFRTDLSQGTTFGTRVPWSAVEFHAVRSGTVLTGTMMLPGDTVAGHWTASLCATCPSQSQTTSISPTSSVQGSDAFDMIVNGTNFTTCSLVRIDDQDRGTTFVSSSQLKAHITVADQDTTGIRTITVFTPIPGGGISNGQTFTILPNHP